MAKAKREKGEGSAERRHGGGKEAIGMKGRRGEARGGAGRRWLEGSYVEMMRHTKLRWFIYFTVPSHIVYNGETFIQWQ